MGAHALATAAFGAAVAEPSARFDVVSAATEFWLASQFHDAENAYAAAVAPVSQTYLTATSDATRTRRVNEANLTSAFEQSWASESCDHRSA